MFPGKLRYCVGLDVCADFAGDVSIIILNDNKDRGVIFRQRIISTVTIVLRAFTFLKFIAKVVSNHLLHVASRI
jgi:hypothetical protein